MAFDATDYTGLIAWWRPDTLGLANGANVTSFTDASGNGLHLTPPGTAPTYDTDEFHGLGVVRYNGTSGQKLQLTNSALDEPQVTLFVVAHIDTWETTQHWLVNKDASSPASIGILRALNNGYHWLAGFRLAASSSTFRELESARRGWPGILVHEFTYDGSTATYRINGRLIDTVSVSGGIDDSPSAAFVLGGHPDVGTYAFNGWFGDVVYYDNALSEGDRDQIVADLLDKWNTNRITVADTGNPILDPPGGVAGTQQLRGPRMVLDGSTYYTLYTLTDVFGAPGDGDGASYATSPANDPFNFTTSGVEIIPSSVNCNGIAAAKSGGTWYVFVDSSSAGGISLYTGSDLESLTLDTTGIIPNIDGSTFVRLPSTPILDGGTWYMLVDVRTGSATAGTGRIDLYSASALDGTWTRVGTVLSPSGADDWEQDDVGSPDWIKIGSTYYMAYSGYSGDMAGDFPHHIGIATSTDRETWTKHAQNPVVWNEPDSWHVISVDGPGWVDYGGVLQILAHGRNAPAPQGGIGRWATTLTLEGAVPEPSGFPRLALTPLGLTPLSLSPLALTPLVESE